MGRDGALLPHRSHGESSPASRSYDKTSQFRFAPMFSASRTICSKGVPTLKQRFEVPKLGAILSDSKGPTNPLPVFLDVFWLRSSVPFNREI